MSATYPTREGLMCNKAAKQMQVPRLQFGGQADRRGAVGGASRDIPSVAGVFRYISGIFAEPDGLRGVVAIAIYTVGRHADALLIKDAT